MQAERLKILLDYLESEPNEPFNIYGVAMEYMNSDKKKAFFYLERLLKEHPEYLPTYYHVGALLTEFSDFKNAILVYKKGIELATFQQKANALRELKGAYQMLLDEIEE